MKRLSDGQVLQEGFGLEDSKGKVVLHGLTLSNAWCELSIRKSAATTAYGEWAIAHSLSGTDALSSTDTDADNLDQITEYSFGGNPWAAESFVPELLRLVANPDASGFEIVYHRRSDAAMKGLSYRIMRSHTLQPGSWTEAAGMPETVQSIGSGLEEVNLSFSQAALPDPTFLKVQSSILIEE